ncbi:MAG: hypothetical protein H6744_13600 [Deltaproteobacteria bacterium]|nr:hypothetical protein [Deltaproteobacteria bacterium]
MTGESEGDGEVVRALRGLLNSPDAAVVAGALDRLAEAGDTALMQATLGLAWVAEAPRMERSRLICCRTPGGLDGAVHSHVASLWLMLAIREAGGALDLRPGKLCVELGSLGPEVYQARHVLGLGAHQVELECSPPLSGRGAFAWAADKALARVEDAGELLRHYARGFLRRLPGLSGGAAGAAGRAPAAASAGRRRRLAQPASLVVHRAAGHRRHGLLAPVGHR